VGIKNHTWRRLNYYTLVTWVLKKIPAVWYCWVKWLNLTHNTQKVTTMLDLDKLPPLAEENPIGVIFTRFPELNVRQVARSMGINETLMQHYVNGVKRPSFDRAMEIERFLHKLGEELTKIEIK
jgi:hypothetical protein